MPQNTDRLSPRGDQNYLRVTALPADMGAIGTFLERIGAPESPLNAGGVETLSNQSCICTQSVENGGQKRSGLEGED